MKSVTQMAATVGLGVLLAATAFAQNEQTKAPPGGTMETEATTKNTGPGVHAKEKSKTVIGIVKKYEPGKKIVVTGPKNKDYSFDLDGNTGVTGDIAVGTKVRVISSKSNGGQKVTTVATYNPPAPGTI